MNKVFFLIATITIKLQLFGQRVNRQILLEHFTNTNCSICASRNPGLQSNLVANPSVIKIAFHPSSPYASCKLSMYNKNENDARTNFYGVYGGTPRITINGNVVSSGADYSSPSIFANYITGKTAFLIKSMQYLDGDSIVCKVGIYKKDTSYLIKANMHTFLVEDSLNYTGGNGESLHFNVFRRNYNNSGIEVTLPSKVNDSVIKIFKVANPPTLVNKQLRTLAILQLNNKQIEQVSYSNKGAKMQSSSTQIIQINKHEIFYFNNEIVIDDSYNLTNKKYTIYAMNGAKISEGLLQKNKITTNNLTSNLYLLKIENSNVNFLFYKY